VGNLEYSTTNEELEELFASEGNVISAKVIRRLDGKSKGFGYVEMETEDEATKAIEKLNQTEFKNRTIYVNEAKPVSNRPDFDRGDRRGGGGYKSRNRDDLNSKLRRLRKRF
jgi:RNA recognition motif-containing protein